MAITTCNLPSPDKRAAVRELLERYDDEHTTITELTAIMTEGLDKPCNPALDVMLPPIEGANAQVCCLYLSELVAVYERRKVTIEAELSKLGISLRNIEDTPSASPVLDQAIRNLGVTDSVTE